MRRTNPDSLRSCLCFRIFRLNFASDFFNLSMDATTRLGWEYCQSCDHDRRKNDAPNHLATLPTDIPLTYNSLQ